MALEIIKERYDPSKWNVYSFHCTDGDEWIEDSNKAAELANKLCSVCNLFGYVEVIPGTYYPNDTFKKTIDSKVKAENLISVRITSKQDVVPALRHILLKESEKDTTID
jgi:uncharacterized sporulation protein YeaH/YhbH (DUF444 family)